MFGFNFIHFTKQLLLSDLLVCLFSVMVSECHVFSTCFSYFLFSEKWTIIQWLLISVLLFLVVLGQKSMLGIFILSGITIPVAIFTLLGVGVRKIFSADGKVFCNSYYLPLALLLTIFVGRLNYHWSGK